MNDVRRVLADVAAREVPAGGVDLWPSIRATLAPRLECVERDTALSWRGRLRGAAEVVWVAALCVGIAVVLRSALDAGVGPAPSPTAGVPGGAPYVTPEPTPEVAPTALPTPTAAPEDPTPAPEPTYEARPIERHQGRLHFLLSANPSDPALTDIDVTDLATGEALGAWSVPDVNVQHYHNVEYHNGRLYVLRRIGYAGEPDDDWSDELWRYDRAGAGEQISSVRGLDFSVSPTEAWIAVRYDERHLTVFDPEERVEPAFSADVVSLAEGHIPTPEMGWWVTLVGWSADGESLWLASTSGPQLVGLLRLTAGEWQVDGYDVSGLPAYWEWDLQPTTGRLAYSDMPMLYDSVAAEEFAASGRPVTLYVLDLDTGQTDVVAISEARRFGPRWVDEETLEYYDPADTSDDPARITVVVPDVPAEARAILVRTTPRW
jgi:hypothetical protein